MVGRRGSLRSGPPHSQPAPPGETGRAPCQPQHIKHLSFRGKDQCWPPPWPLFLLNRPSTLLTLKRKWPVRTMTTTRPPARSGNSYHPAEKLSVEFTGHRDGFCLPLKPRALRRARCPGFSVALPEPQTENSARPEQRQRPSGLPAASQPPATLAAQKHSPGTLELLRNHILRITHQLYLSTCQNCHREVGSPDGI